MLKLIIEDDEGRKTVVPFVREEITIGRQEGNTIRLTERNVSRRHARLTRQNSQVLIEDLGSYNGIKVNGDKIAGQVRVNDGDLIQIGDYDLAIQREDVASQVTPHDRASSAPTSPHSQAVTVPLEPVRPLSSTQAITKPIDTAATIPGLPIVSPSEKTDEDDDDDEESEPVGEGNGKHQATAVIRIDQIQGSRPSRSVRDLDSSEAPRLVVLNTDFAGREFAVVRTETKIGRVDDNDIVIDHRSLSRTHCKLVREDNGEWRVIDMQSANGLLVNGEPYAQVTLRTGDVIELGHVKIKFLGPGESGPATSASTETTTSGVETAETPVAPATKTPLIAIAIAIAVLVIGLGGYVLSRNPATNGGNTAGGSGSQPDEDPAKVATEKADADKLVAQARELIEKADLASAEVMLRAAKVGGAPYEPAVELVAQMQAEKPMAAAIQEAQAALDKKELPAVKAALDRASATKLMGKRVTELRGRYTELLEQQVATPKPPPNTPPQVSPQEEIAKLIEEAKTLSKEQRFDQAKAKLERCLKLDSRNLVCIRSLGSTYGRIAQKTGAAADTEKQRELYQQYVRIAPPDDPMVPKIRALLEGN